MSRGTRLIVTGTDATGLAKPSAETDIVKALPEQDVRVDASSAVATDIAQVGGKLHIFFANFDGLVGGQERRADAATRRSCQRADGRPAVRRSFSRFWGKLVELHGQRENGRLVFTLPEIQKGAIFWCEK